MKQNSGEVKQESGGVVIPTWLFWLMLVNAILWFADKFFDLIKGNDDRGAETVYVVEKKEGSDRDDWRVVKVITVRDVKEANLEQTVKGFQPKATATSGTQTKGM